MTSQADGSQAKRAVEWEVEVQCPIQSIDCLYRLERCLSTIELSYASIHSLGILVPTSYPSKQ